MSESKDDNKKLPKHTSLVDIFNNLKIGILGTETSKIDNYIDKRFNKVDKYNEKLSQNTYLTAIKDLFNSNTQPSNLTSVNKDKKEPMDIGEEIENIVQDASVNSIGLIDNSNRIQRYKEYEAIVSKISHCKRALQVLTNNIISPDDITKQSIDIIPNSSSEVKENNVEKTIKELNLIKKDLDFDIHVNDIVYTTLLKGDKFVEIIHSPKGELAHVILNEDERFSKQTKSIEILLNEIEIPINEKSKLPLFNKPRSIIIDGFDSNVITEEEKNENKFKAKHDKIQNIELKDLFLTMHKPEYVIRLESERFRSCLGYLVFPKIDLNSSNPLINMNSALQGNGVYFTNTQTENPVNDICKKIIDSLHSKINTSDTVMYNNKDLHDTVLKYLETIKNDEDLKIRYVAPNQMVHFRIDTSKFDPYGESIFDSVLLECKILMALKVAHTIKQLTYCTDKRIISVEAGLPRNAKHIIEKVKETMRKRKISIDSLGSIDTIPSQIATFEDIYIPMIDGKEYIRFDQREWGQNPSGDIENLKHFRDNLVANLGVPSAHIGIEENVSNRSLLTQENIVFARTIIAYQKQFSVYLKELFEKIYTLLHPNKLDDLDDIFITFPSPKIAQYEHEMEYVEQMNRLFDVYKTLEIPIKFLKRKYLPNVDWEAIEEMNNEEKIDKTIDNEKKEESGGGYGGY